MKNINMHLCALTSMLAMVSAHGQWLHIADIQSYEVGDDKAELRSYGWTFQDGDHYGYLQCTDGTSDCTSVRKVVSAPYNPTGGNPIDKAFELRAGDPAQPFLAGAKAATAISLPQEIPVNDTATIYIRFAIEAAEGVRTFSTTDQIAADSSPNGTVSTDWGQQNVALMVNQDLDLLARAEGANRVALPNGEKISIHTWYEMWIHVDNKALDAGDTLGGRYDVYMRGGQFNDITHIPNTHPDYVAIGFESWLYRRNVGEPQRTLFFITEYGDPGAVIRGSAAAYIGELAMFPGEFSLATPNYGAAASDWYGYPVDESGWADTDDWMGWLYVANDPWVYSEQIGWTYIAADGVDAEGGWVWAVK